MTALKNEISPELVVSLGSEIGRAWADFPARQWQRQATDGLDSLELMERVDHLAQILGRCLPAGFTSAAAILNRTLDSPTFTGWMTLPCGVFVSEAGIDEPETALPLLAALSPRFSSESPMRVFIEKHPDLTFEYLRRWVDDPDDHVRRLVSECTRPRLPWARRLNDLMADPSPSIALLDRLFDDESAYVRQSVANHLNDIAKDHPELAIECAKRWLAASNHGNRVARHGLRTLIKHGNAEALAVLGYDQSVEVTLDSLTIKPDRIAIGDVVKIEAVLRAAASTRVAMDYLVHHQGARGLLAPKVFKLTSRTIEADTPCRVTKNHRFRHLSIRTIHPGTHRIELQVNGHVLGGQDIEILIDT